MIVRSIISTPDCAYRYPNEEFPSDLVFCLPANWLALVTTT